MVLGERNSGTSWVKRELAARFAPFGKVCATQLICDSATGAPRGFGYVTLEAEEAAVERCLKVYRGTKWRGQPLHVQPANESYLARLQREWQQAAADEAEAALAAAEAQSAGGEEAEGAAPLWGPHELRVRRGHAAPLVVAKPGETNAHVRTFAPPPPKRRRDDAESTVRRQRAPPAPAPEPEDESDLEEEGESEEEEDDDDDDEPGVLTE